MRCDRWNTPTRTMCEIDIHRLQRAYSAVGWRWTAGTPSVQDLNVMLAFLLSEASALADTLWASSGGLAAGRMQLIKFDPTIEAAYAAAEAESKKLLQA